MIFSQSALSCLLESSDKRTNSRAAWDLLVGAAVYVHVCVCFVNIYVLLEILHYISTVNSYKVLTNLSMITFLKFFFKNGSFYFVYMSSYI